MKKRNLPIWCFDLLCSAGGGVHRAGRAGIRRPRPWIAGDVDGDVDRPFVRVTCEIPLLPLPRSHAQLTVQCSHQSIPCTVSSGQKFTGKSLKKKEKFTGNIPIHKYLCWYTQMLHADHYRSFCFFWLCVIPRMARAAWQWCHVRASIHSYY